jgi:hypothetical protein
VLPSRPTETSPRPPAKFTAQEKRLLRTRLGPGVLIVADAILGDLNRHRRQVWRIKAGRIAALTGFSKGTVCCHLRALVRNGVLTIPGRRPTDSRTNPNGHPLALVPPKPGQKAPPWVARFEAEGGTVIHPRREARANSAKHFLHLPGASCGPVGPGKDLLKWISPYSKQPRPLRRDERFSLTAEIRLKDRQIRGLTRAAKAQAVELEALRGFHEDQAKKIRSLRAEKLHLQHRHAKAIRRVIALRHRFSKAKPESIGPPPDREAVNVAAGWQILTHKRCLVSDVEAAVSRLGSVGFSRAEALASLKDGARGFKSSPEIHSPIRLFGATVARGGPRKAHPRPPDRHGPIPRELKARLPGRTIQARQNE